MLTGYIQSYDGSYITVVVPYDNDFLLEKQGITECEVTLLDGRRISAEQRRKIYATFKDIALWTGYVPDEIKAILKYEFIAKKGCEYFSLSDVNMTLAKEFLEFLIEFCLQHDIPTSDSLLERSPDIARYVYMCLKNKKCCITGKRAELHHVDAVGMGRDRKDIIHTGMRVLPLSRKKHTESHTIGQKSFEEKYHIFGIKLTPELCKIWKVKDK